MISPLAECRITLSISSAATERSARGIADQAHALHFGVLVAEAQPLALGLDHQSSDQIATGVLDRERRAACRMSGHCCPAANAARRIAARPASRQFGTKSRLQAIGLLAHAFQIGTRLPMRRDVTRGDDQPGSSPTRNSAIGHFDRELALPAVDDQFLASADGLAGGDVLHECRVVERRDAAAGTAGPRGACRRRRWHRS